MFKTLVGKGHPEFSTKRQQDAQEFFLHIINILEVHLLGYKMFRKLFIMKICLAALMFTGKSNNLSKADRIIRHF